MASQYFATYSATPSAGGVFAVLPGLPGEFVAGLLAPDIDVVRGLARTPAMIGWLPATTEMTQSGRRPKAADRHCGR
jgi:hypothetical protein